MKATGNLTSLLIRVEGLVQGVGFRPFVYRIAERHDVKGWVENRTDGVLIRAEAGEIHLGAFLEDLKLERPPASSINKIDVRVKDPENFRDFRILKSDNQGDAVTQVSPDIAVCNDCLEDMKLQKHRKDYPFINCTNCGPRFTIIRDLPYDREMTTMQPFGMCDKCRQEYTAILDRRFHAQPVACNICGPQYRLYYNGGQIAGLKEILNKLSEIILGGGIVAIKGLGGYFLACDAGNQQSVDRLREIKNRDGKPFAVMFGNMNSLKEYLQVNPDEEQILSSWRRPILLARKIKSLAPGVSMGFSTTGAMLPYMPIHYLLFKKLELPAIVLTSGNISEEPIIIKDEKALEVLGPVSDAVLTYNREIHNRADDSVTSWVNARERLIRRSRGYVPGPVLVNSNVDGILAAGAELVNCFAIGRNKQAILSQHIGDLKNLETLDFYTESIERFKRLFRFQPEMIACDMHPDYLSTKWAKDQAVDLFPVQHHHAHIASCMAEHGLDEEVIGVAMDGVGYGDDGKIWGGEFLQCDLKEYRRKIHFDYVPMPGGDAATKNPWRMALSYLIKYAPDIEIDTLEAFENIPTSEIQLVKSAIEKNINAPLTSSCGRLFDAVSALTGLCTVSSFHAEAPMRLEAAIAENIQEAYDFEIKPDIVSFELIFRGILEDLSSGKAVGEISAKFHNTLISIIFAAVKKISEEIRISKVVLSGGTFQNRYLLQETEKKLRENGFTVYSHSEIPTNDGGIALGQLIIASKNRR